MGTSATTSVAISNIDRKTKKEETAFLVISLMESPECIVISLTRKKTTASPIPNKWESASLTRYVKSLLEDE